MMPFGVAEQPAKRRVIAMQSRPLILLLLIGAVIVGIVVALIVRSSDGPSAGRLIDGLIVVAIPAMTLITALWELRKRRQGKRTGLGRTWWERGREIPPLPSRFLAVGLLQLWFVPLGLGISAALRLGGAWFLVPLLCTSITALALIANYHVEQHREHAH